MVEPERAFHRCQRRAETAVDAMAEAEVLCLGSISVDVEAIWFGERSFVAVRGGRKGHHRLVRRNSNPMQPHVFATVATVVLHRTIEPQHLLDGIADIAALGTELPGSA